MPTWYMRPPKRDQNLGKDNRTKVTNGNHVKNRQGGVFAMPVQPMPVKQAPRRR